MLKEGQNIRQRLSRSSWSDPNDVVATHSSRPDLAGQLGAARGSPGLMGKKAAEVYKMQIYPNITINSHVNSKHIFLDRTNSVETTSENHTFCLHLDGCRFLNSHVLQNIKVTIGNLG